MAGCCEITTIPDGICQQTSVTRVYKAADILDMFENSEAFSGPLQAP